VIEYIDRNWAPAGPFVVIFNSRYVTSCELHAFLTAINDSQDNKGRGYFIALHPDYSVRDLNNSKVLFNHDKLQVFIADEKFKEAWDKLLLNAQDYYIYSGIACSVTKDHVIHRKQLRLSGLLQMDPENVYNQLVDNK
jgi:hypothetical protein